MQSAGASRNASSDCRAASVKCNRVRFIPVLQRLARRGWIVAEWRATENHRRARYYRLTATGRRQLDAEVEWWRRTIGGVDRVLRAAAQEG